jgi:hypothetical protein
MPWPSCRTHSSRTIQRDETIGSLPISARSSSRTRPETLAGLDFSTGAVAGELCKVRLDRDVAVIGCSQLPNSGGMLVRVLAADGAALKLALHQAWCAARLALKGSLPVERRK